MTETEREEKLKELAQAEENDRPFEEIWEEIRGVIENTDPKK